MHSFSIVMKTTPVKVSTPSRLMLPPIVEEGSNEEFFDEISLNSEKDAASAAPTADNSHISSSSSSSECNDFAVPTERMLRRMDYQSARLQRRAFSCAAVVSGTMGLFEHVSEIRTDLAWVETKAYFRKRNLTFLSWQEHEERKQLHTPFVSYILSVVCTVLLFVTFAVNDWKFEKLSLNPSLGPSTDALMHMGALTSTQVIERDEWYRIFAATVLHGGIFHWLLNVAAILYMGPALERIHGSLKVAVVFVVAGPAANLVTAILSPFSISVGASGGICAWYGFSLVDGLTHWPLLQVLHASKLEVIPFHFVPAILFISFELLFLILIGLLPWVDNFGHMGGIFFGVCMGSVLIQPAGGASLLGLRPKLSWSPCLQWKLRATLACLAVAFCAINVLWLYHSADIGDLPCRHCRYYLDCPPLSAFEKFCDPCRFMHEALYKLLPDGLLEIELHCPYKDTAYFVTDEALPDDRDGWVGLCRDHCDV